MYKNSVLVNILNIIPTITKLSRINNTCPLFTILVDKKLSIFSFNGYWYESLINNIIDYTGTSLYLTEINFSNPVELQESREITLEHVYSELKYKKNFNLHIRYKGQLPYITLFLNKTQKEIYNILINFLNITASITLKEI